MILGSDTHEEDNGVDGGGSRGMGGLACIPIAMLTEAIFQRMSGKEIPSLVINFRKSDPSDGSLIRCFLRNMLSLWLVMCV